MKIQSIPAINFERRLKPSEEAEYSDVLSRGREKCIKGNPHGKKIILVVPATSLPNKTGAGNLSSPESGEFFDFAKKYWGINEIQILPVGQYHSHRGEYPIYSGTSMDLGNHVIDIQKYVSKEDFDKIVKSNKIKDRVNFSNVVDKDSIQEKILRKLYKSGKYQKELEDFKRENIRRLEPKALYGALREINGSYNYKAWNNIDRNLFNRDIVSEKEFRSRVSEVKKLKGEEMDFYYFKQFLAEASLKNAKQALNEKGIKLNGDMQCGFSFDEVWARPEAFLPETSIGWGLPALNLDSCEGQKLLREKADFYAKRFDGVRIDAAWTYANQPQIKNRGKERKYYAGKILDIIDDEFKKVKGSDFDTRNIMHEFAASKEDFDIYDGAVLKLFVKDRVKIYTSDHMNKNWGTNKNFLERGWNGDSFIIGARNHDSGKLQVTNPQAEVLAEILKIPEEKLKQDRGEFIKAKLAEPFAAKYNMIYFADALGIDGEFQGNSDKTLNYAVQIPLDYQEKYFASLERTKNVFGKPYKSSSCPVFNPMDALEKQFKAQGLNKTEPELYRKIVKYRKILEQSEKPSNLLYKAVFGLACTGLIVYLCLRFRKNNMHK